MDIKKIIIVLLVGVGLFLRFYRLDSLPPHLSNDEISIAYDAYSLSRSGADEHGHLWPLSFESHGTYKAPLYAYVLAPVVKVFGNNDLSARMPSAIAGIITVLLVGMVAYKISNNKNVGIAAAIVLLLTPWHIVASRMVLEANLALAIFAGGVLCLAKNRYWLASIVLAVSMYGYHSEWIIAPILLVTWGGIYLRNLKTLGIMVAIFAMIAAPLGIDFVKNAGPGSRAKSEMIWKESSVAREIESSTNLLKPIKAILPVGRNYLHYTNPAYLWGYGLDLLPKNQPFQPGLMLWPLAAAFALGVLIIRKIKITKNQTLLYCWLGLSFLPSAITQGENNWVRNLHSVLPLTIITAIGFEAMRTKWKLILAGISGVAIVYFGIVYLVVYPFEKAVTFQGYREPARYLKSVEDRAGKIFVDYRYGDYRGGHGEEFIGVPHLYLGYYNYWEPGVIQSRTYGKYKIEKVDWNCDEIVRDAYYLVSISNPPTDKVTSKLAEVAVFNDAAGKKAFVVYRGK